MRLPFKIRNALTLFKKYIEKAEPLINAPNVLEILNILLGESTSEEAIKKSVERLRRLVYTENKKESLEAACLLGYCYDSALGVAVNRKRAIELYEFSAKQGHPIANNNLGILYELGLGVDKDYGRAVAHYQLAVDKGIEVAQSNLANMYIDGLGVAKDEKRAFELITLSANQGSATGQFLLAFCYKDGLGVTKDEKRAFEFYCLAANQGSDDALNNLAYHYDCGCGVSEDKRRALECYTLSSSRGYAQAQENLAIFYKDGFGFGKDIRRAVLLFQAASSIMDYSKEMIARIYQEYGGQNSDLRNSNFPNLDKAAAYYNDLKDRDPSVLSTLAFCYQMGLGVPQDVEKALELYRLCLSKKVHVDAWDFYMCYRIQHHLTGDSKALKALREFYEAVYFASQKGDREATRFFAYLHEYGAPALPDWSLCTAHRCYLSLSQSQIKHKDAVSFEKTEIEYEFEIEEELDVHKKVMHFTPWFILQSTIQEAGVVYPGIADIIAEYAFDPDKEFDIESIFR